MSIRREIQREIGDPEQYKRQRKICLGLELPLVGPVYRSYKPHAHRLSLLREVIPFLGLYEVVTVRQVYYNLVSRQIINNDKKEYEKVSDLLVRARLAGIIDFEKIIDETREPQRTPTWSSMEQIIRRAIEQYRSDWWDDQECYVEVWLEKRALSRIFFPITDSVGITLCVGGGYQSWSGIHEASKRFDKHLNKQCKILYFGDLDPSGRDMPRDIQDRFRELGVPVDVVEVALSIDDVERYSLPRNPTERRAGRSREDPRRRWYIERYGIDYGVELDALPPEILKNKIRQSITGYVNVALIKRHIAVDQAQRDNWNQVIDTIIEAIS